jgi:hypothetical protein
MNELKKDILQPYTKKAALRQLFYGVPHQPGLIKLLKTGFEGIGTASIPRVENDNRRNG